MLVSSFFMAIACMFFYCHSFLSDAKWMELGMFYFIYCKTLLVFANFPSRWININLIRNKKSFFSRLWLMWVDSRTITIIISRRVSNNLDNGDLFHSVWYFYWFIPWSDLFFWIWIIFVWLKDSGMKALMKSFCVDFSILKITSLLLWRIFFE